MSSARDSYIEIISIFVSKILGELNVISSFMRDEMKTLSSFTTFKTEFKCSVRRRRTSFSLRPNKRENELRNIIFSSSLLNDPFFISYLILGARTSQGMDLFTSSRIAGLLVVIPSTPILISFLNSSGSSVVPTITERPCL